MSYEENVLETFYSGDKQISGTYHDRERIYYANYKHLYIISVEEMRANFPGKGIRELEIIYKKQKDESHRKLKRIFESVLGEKFFDELEVPIELIKPSPENMKIYNPEKEYSLNHLIDSIRASSGKRRGGCTASRRLL